MWHRQLKCVHIASALASTCTCMSQQVLSSLNKINYFSTAKHFDSFDFTALYTSIPHTSLLEALTSLIKEAYKVRDNIFLVVGNRGIAYWSHSS